MGKTVEENLKKMNTTGIEWDCMTDAQKEALRREWDAIVSDPNELYCTCTRSSCRNNHNCKFCIGLHRYYDGLPDCLRGQLDQLQEELPKEKKYNVHLKIQSDGTPPEAIDPYDAELTRARLGELAKQGLIEDPANKWAAIVKNSRNTACTCPHSDCWYHGNCVKCIALHRHFGGYPYCVRYIVDEVDNIIDAYHEEQSET